ncbi:MAG: UDP-N-acetylmuramate--L-alanine ligase [Clostridia bacterium]|nr:UDP-N-acetylmuramate--L-alanine ligase [Clostridia bacterium]
MKNSKIDNLNGIKKIHFIGIGGSGMFPLAQILKQNGFEVTGSDVYESDTLEKVKKLGIKVNLSQEKENVSDQDLVVFSAAIKETNPEICAAKEKNIPIIERSVMLGIIFNKYKNSVGIAGTHGKTTTTSMITTVLLDAGKSPTAVIGGMLPKLGSNAAAGNSDIIVAEACEYVDSFLCLNPRISVITNVDADHLDYFKTFENVKKSFNKFANQTSDLVVLNGDDKGALDSTKNIKAKKVTFGFSDNCDYCAKNIKFDEKQFSTFDIYKNGKKIAEISLSVPGNHNIYDSLAAFIVCEYLGVLPEDIASSLKNFSGAHRRFEILANIGGITVIDDFAHHPAELETTLLAASKMGFKRVWAIFQPHTYSRTAMLLDDFAKALSIPEKAIISEILPVRETNTYGIHSEDLVKKIPGAVYIPTFEEITDYIIKNASNGDLIITMGGGNIYKCAGEIVKKLKEKNN